MLRRPVPSRLAAATIAGALFLAAWPGPGGASPDAGAAAEIEHLLRFVERSSCTFLRGNDESNGTRARAHLELKYRHARSSLSTADEFVHRVASASSVTGQPYRVRCAGREIDTGPWLAGELDRRRKAGTPASRAASPADR